MRFPVKIFKISGHSMEPHFPEGSYVLVNTWVRYIAVNDVIAFTFNGQIYIKRIIHTGDNSYEVRGDNPDDSLDSRDFGYIDKPNIIGTVIWH